MIVQDNTTGGDRTRTGPGQDRMAQYSTGQDGVGLHRIKEEKKKQRYTIFQTKKIIFYRIEYSYCTKIDFDLRM